MVEEDVSTHKRVKSKYNQHLVRPGLVVPDPDGDFNKLFSIRYNTDYQDFSEISEADVLAFRGGMQKLLSTIRKLVLD